MDTVDSEDVSAASDSLAVGYVTIDPDWRITRVNAAAEQAVGSTAAELVGRDLWDMFPGTRELEFGPVYERVMTTREPETFEAFNPGLDLHLELRVQPAEPGIAVYFLDVTARHKAEEAATAARLRLELLSRVSEVLTSSDNPNVALARLARLVVPQLADWTVVTVIDDDRNFLDVGWAHKDPAREDEVAAYGAIQSASMSDGSPVATGLRTGEPVLVPYLSDEALEAALVEPVAIEIAKRLDPHGVAVLPFTARGRTLGMIALVTTRERGPHTPDEIDTAMEVARRAGPVLDSTRAAERALRLAESLQLSLLDVSPPATGVEIVTRYPPAYDDRQVGGDWYDAFVLPTGSTVVTIGDVMGHDLSAIAGMAQLRTMMRTAAWTLRHSPAEVLSATDDTSAGLGPGTFATALTADLSPAGPDGSVLMRWSNAGHPPPAVLGPDGAVTLLDSHVPDVPLGVDRNVTRNTHEVTLAPGSVLLLYTDGLLERRDRDLHTGLSELSAVLGRLAGEPVETLLDSLLGELSADEVQHHDDVAMIAVRVAPVSTSAEIVVDLPFGLDAPAVARRFLNTHARQLPEPLRGDAELLVSEIVTNAIRYGQPSVTMQIRYDPPGIAVSVTDHGPGLPLLPDGRPDPESPSGRGLLIIAAVADTWGVTPNPEGTGKTVWFELRDPSATG